MGIAIRSLRELSEMNAAVELQTVYWGTDVESLVPGQMLITIIKAGGHVIGAFDGDRMVGVLIGLLSADGIPARDNLRVYSKRMVVLPEYRGQGIAQRLKLAQLETARQQGVMRVAWTYDPLLSVNAHFNIRKLGCVAHEYAVDYYGRDVDDYGLSILGSSDRLIASWHADDPGVVARAEEQYVPKSLDDYLAGGAQILNLSNMDGGVPYPAQTVMSNRRSEVLVEIPRDFRGIANAFPDLAHDWRRHSQALLVQLMSDGGLSIVDFVGADYQGGKRSFYVLARYGAPDYEGE